MALWNYCKDGLPFAFVAMQAATKKTQFKKTAAAVAKPGARGVSYAAASALLDTERRRVGEAVDAKLDISTPYGNLTKNVAVPQEGGDDVQWLVANPFALLWTLGNICPMYAAFLQQCLGPAALGHLVLYCDGVTPGQNIVQWRGREVVNWYWTLAEFPAWFRSQEQGGWLPFGCLKATVITKIPGKYSGLAKIVLRQFFATDWFNMAEGMRLPLGGQNFFSFKAVLSCFMQDGLAHKQVTSTKGAAGIVCCISCRNILNTEPSRIEASAGLHHYSTAKAGDMKLHTHATFYANCDRLQASHGHSHPKDFEILEKACGISYDPHSVAYDLGLRGVYSIPDDTYHDPMHILVASGGLVQYEINAFLFHAVKQGPNLSLALLDTFCRDLFITGKGLRSEITGKPFFVKRHTLNHAMCFVADAFYVIGEMC